MTLKLRAVGTSTGLRAKRFVATNTRDGLVLSHHDPEVARQVKLGEEFLDEYCETFRELAK